MKTSLSSRAVLTLARLMRSQDPEVALGAARTSLMLLRDRPGQPRGRLNLDSLEVLTPEEDALLEAYRNLDSVPRLAVRRFVLSGDIRLVRAIYNQVCLGIRPRR